MKQADDQKIAMPTVECIDRHERILRFGKNTLSFLIMLLCMQVTT